jgi:beta-glucanase (GH16 family)
MTCRVVITALLLVWSTLWPGTTSGRSGTRSVVNWKLIWSDEFDHTRLDTRKWKVIDSSRPNYDGGINYYDPENVSVRDGQLILRTQIHRRLVAGKSELYGSGKVTTSGKFSFLYGKLEVRAKLPGTQGQWPAIWMLPADGTWPPEIDVMELLGDAPRRVYMTLHWGKRKDPLQFQSKFDGEDFTGGFHVFAIEWSPGELRWFIDGTERGRVFHDVPDRAMFLLLNTSIGGDWPGPPGRQTMLPQEFQIDYVRVYQAAR